MKQFVKALSKEGECFKYICTKFPGQTIEKLKSGIFDGPKIRKLLTDQEFPLSMSQQEFFAWDAFVKVVKKLFWKQNATTKSL